MDARRTLLAMALLALGVSLVPARSADACPSPSSKMKEVAEDSVTRTQNPSGSGDGGSLTTNGSGEGISVGHEQFLALITLAINYDEQECQNPQVEVTLENGDGTTSVSLGTSNLPGSGVSAQHSFGAGKSGPNAAKYKQIMDAMGEKQIDDCYICVYLICHNPESRTQVLKVKVKK